MPAEAPCQVATGISLHLLELGLSTRHEGKTFYSDWHSDIRGFTHLIFPSKGPVTNFGRAFTRSS